MPTAPMMLCKGLRRSCTTRSVVCSRRRCNSISLLILGRQFVDLAAQRAPGMRRRRDQIVGFAQARTQLAQHADVEFGAVRQHALKIVARDVIQIHFIQRHHRSRARQIFQQRHFADEFARAPAGQHDGRVETAFDDGGVARSDEEHGIARFAFAADDLPGRADHRRGLAQIQAAGSQRLKGAGVQRLRRTVRGGRAAGANQVDLFRSQDGRHESGRAARGSLALHSAALPFQQEIPGRPAPNLSRSDRGLDTT